MTQKPNLPAEWRSRRTRHEPSVLDEAIAAARCLTDHVDSQIEITAQLIGLPVLHQTAKTHHALLWSNEEVRACR